MAMKNSRLVLSILIATVLISSLTSFVGAETLVGSKSWPTFRGNSSHTGATTDNSSNGFPMLLWRYTTGKAILSSPSVANGCVVFGSDDTYIYCLNASNGQLVWRFPTGDIVKSSPTIENGRVFITSEDGYLYCLNLTAGWPFWIKWVGGFAQSSPVVVGDYVFVGSGENGLYCFNFSDGSVVWNYQTNYQVESSPTVSDGAVYFSCNNFCVYAINESTGTELWHTHTGSDISSPSVNDGYVYVGSYDGYVCALNSSVGSQIWKHQTGNQVYSSPAVANGFVWIGSNDNSVYCLNASDGKKVWQAPTGYWVWSSPAFDGGNIFVGSEDYNLYCLNASTGMKKWSYPMGGSIDSSPTLTDGVLYVGSSDHNMYALQLGNSTMEETVVQPSTATSLNTAIFDGIAFFITSSIIVALTLYIRKHWSANRNITVKKASWFSRHSDTVFLVGILALSTIFFVNLGSGNLWASDEQTYSQWAFHMTKTGDYLTPWAFGETAIGMGKPPLSMWLMSLSYQVFGATNFAARLPIATLGALSLVFVFYLGKKLYNAYVGLLASVVLATFATFYTYAWHAMTDIPLVFFLVATLYFFVLSQENRNPGIYAALSGLCFGLALLTKQMAALLIPIIIIVYLGATKRNLRALFTKQLAVFLGSAALVFGPWVLYMSYRFGYTFWNCYFLYADLSRAMNPLEGHSHGLLYYFSYLATNETPLWIVLLPFATALCGYFAFKQSKGDLLVLTWMGTVMLLFTAVQTKIWYYILPAYPAFALAIASLLYQIPKKLKQAIAKNQRVIPTE
jgi:outer membrane protein assembly factor BamB